jgi:hypothetical protein
VFEFGVGHFEAIHQIIADNDRPDVLEGGILDSDLSAADADHLPG